MPGIVSSLLRGMKQARDEQNDQSDRDWLAQQRDHIAARQPIEDQQRDDAYSARQQAVNFANQRAPVLADQSDKSWTAKQAIADNQVGRIGTTNQQTDTLFNERMQDHRQLRGMRAAESGREQTRFGDQQADRARDKPIADMRAKIGMSDLQVEQKRQQYMNALSGGVQQWQADGNVQHVVDAVNQSITPDNPSTLSRDAKGNYIIKPAHGNPIKIGTAADVVKHAAVLAQPENMIAALAHAQDVGGISGALTDAAGVAEKVERQALNSNAGDAGAASDAGMKAADNYFFLRTGKHIADVRKGFDYSAHAAPPPAGPYKEGTRLKGPGGKMFVVKNGVPVPAQ